MSMSRGRYGVVILLSAMWAATGASAQTTNNWASGVSGKWELATNWTVNVAPNMNSLVFITSATTKTVTIDATTALSNSTMTVSNLTLSAPSGSVNKLLLSDPGTNNPFIALQACTISSGGLLVVSNAEMRVQSVNVAGPLKDDGEVVLISPSARLFVTNSTGMFIGSSGQGILTISNGLVTTSGTGIGLNVGSAGTLTIVSGTNLVSFASVLHVGNSGASGTVWVTGGRLDVPGTATTSVLGYFGDGRMTVSNGTVNIPYFEVTQEAAGTLTLAGGTMTSSTRFDVGFSAAIPKTGTVWITGGTLITSNAPTTLGAGTAGGNGRLVLSNGTWLAGTVNMGRNAACRGTLTVNGGTNTFFSTLTIGDETNSTGAVWLTEPGRLVITNAVTIIAARGTGQMTISNGTFLGNALNLATNVTATGTLTVAGGTNALIGPLNVGGPGVGVVWVTGGQLVITNSPATVGIGSGLIVDGRVTLTNGSSLVVSNVQTVIGNAGSGSLTVFGGSTLFNSLFVGHLNNSFGTITFAGGTNRTLGTTFIGFNGGQGTVWVTGGLLNATTNFAVEVGVSGSGQLILSNGTMRGGQIAVGVNVGGNGTFTMTGGTLDGPAALSVANNSFATGTVWVTGGTLVLTNNIIDNEISEGGIGAMTVSNGSIFARNLFIGSSALSAVGLGTLTMAGGSNSVYNSMILGKSACTATGVVTVAGGALFVTNATHTAVLDVRSGILQLESGTLTVDNLVITNVCGRLVKTGGTLSATTTNLDPNLSAVGDGIPNGWKQQYGLDPFDPDVANKDPDGDGMNNLQEYLAGTDPTNSASALLITSIVTTGNNIRVTWTTGPGKTNALERTAGNAGNFATNSFAAITNIITTGAATNYLDAGAATNGPALYYRVRLVP
ncbi:MAG TPA: hypothetical protein VNL17_13985 [Verrucomicrobiae bacterium]|nr:hypothetical protein [Verrucomicrobiae bacterium]